MKKILVITMVVLVVLTISGCKKTETKPGIVVAGETELDKDINDLDSANQDLNTSDLDNLDKDLEKVNW